MMTAAALMNIDSCPMEGFDLDGVTELLEHEGIIDSNQFAPSVMVAFGYRKRILQNLKHVNHKKM